MKKLIYLLVLLLLGCNTENTSDCFQASGRLTQTIVEVSGFERILVNRNIELTIQQAPEYSVVIETGENLINDVTAVLTGNQLVLTDNNNCNYFRDYSSTKILVTAPNITEIRTASQFDVRSSGVLNFDSLTLYSEDYSGNSAFTVGDFRLHLASKDVNVIGNNLSFFYLKGTVQNLFVGFYSGSGRFEGKDLTAQHVEIYHRSTNDMVVRPIQSLTGQLRGIGNLISIQQPNIVDVERFYTGQLIFN